jgi:cell division protein FtsI/penicillin-binding protein 2
MKNLLKRVTEDGGTGAKARVEGYTVAGKTGTAQKALPTGGYSATLNVSSFVGFLPADDPEIAIIVVLDEPKGAVRTGGYVCCPVFKAIAEKSVRYLDIPSENTNTFIAGKSEELNKQSF